MLPSNELLWVVTTVFSFSFFFMPFWQFWKHLLKCNWNFTIKQNFLKREFTKNETFHHLPTFMSEWFSKSMTLFLFCGIQKKMFWEMSVFFFKWGQVSDERIFNFVWMISLRMSWSFWFSVLFAVSDLHWNNFF